MKLNLVFALILLTLLLGSCEVVGGIFKAGVWVGVFAVVVIIGIVLYLFSRSRK